MTDQDGVKRASLTNAFGYFNVGDLEAGRTYLIEIGTKRFTYAPRSISVVDDVVDLDFIPSE